jgi:RPA family protein
MVERQNSKNVRISDLLSGVFLQGDRDTMRPNTIVTPLGEQVGRARLVGTVVEKFQSNDGRFASLTVDDGTGAIRVRVFESDLKLISDFENGDLVSVVGKVKSFRDETYLGPDFVRKLDDPNSETLFRLEVLRDMYDRKKAADEIRSMHDQMSEEELTEYAMQKYGIDAQSLNIILQAKSDKVDYKPLILDVISKLDQGEGAEIAKILEGAKLDEGVAESAISELLESGDLYEPVVGKLKRI